MRTSAGGGRRRAPRPGKPIRAAWQESGGAPSLSAIETGILVEAEFLEGFAHGPRFAVWVTPRGREPIGSVLCLQPIGEEMNLSRRVLALQARRLARLGWAVLILDLYGCGDSPGEIEDATLALWRADMLRAAMHVRERASGPTVLWGIRVGALFAVDISAAMVQLVDGIVLWAPPPLGRTWLASWRRLGRLRQIAGEYGELGTVAETTTGSTAAIDTLTRPTTGSAPEKEFETIAGSRYQPSLLAAIGELSLAPNKLCEVAGHPPTVLLVEMRADPKRATTPSKLFSIVAEQWLDSGYLLSARTVHAEPFWAVLEPEDPVEVFEATEEFLAILPT